MEPDGWFLADIAILTCFPWFENDAARWNTLYHYKFSYYKLCHELKPLLNVRYERNVHPIIAHLGRIYERSGNHFPYFSTWYTWFIWLDETVHFIVHSSHPSPPYHWFFFYISRCISLLLHRFGRGRSCRAKDASVLSVWWHGEHSVQDGVHRRRYYTIMYSSARDKTDKTRSNAKHFLAFSRYAHIKLKGEVQ